MLGWLLKRKWVVISASLSALVLAAYIHIRIDTKRIYELKFCTLKRAELLGTIEDRDAQILSQNAKIGRLNQQLIDLTNASKERVARAEAEAASVRWQRDVISGELAEARADLQEALTNDKEYADWADDDVPAIVWMSLRKAKTRDHRVPAGSDREGNNGSNTSRPNDDP